MNPRNYQIEMHNLARDQNVIIKLNTGAGKTFIAAMLIKDYLNDREYLHKKIFLLVKNASLAHQHKKTLEEYLFLTDEIGIFYGQMDNSWVDYWTKDMWTEKLSAPRIIVMTAKVFLDILNHKKYSLDQVSFLIFDEIHHLTKSDDYAQISEHVGRLSSGPKILGLTACLIKGVKRAKDVELSIMELEKKLNCRVITSRDTIANDFSEKVEEIFISYNVQEGDQDIRNELQKTITNLKDFSDSTDQQTNVDGFTIESNSVGSLIKYLNECLSVYDQLGALPCYMVVKMFIEDMKNKRFELINETENLQYFDLFISCLETVKEKIKIIQSQLASIHCTNKCQELIKLIMAFKSQIPDKLSILIFTKERMHALALNELFTLLPDINKTFDFIKSKFIIGHAVVQYPKKLRMNVNLQSKILKEYKENIFNILFATNVVEEGLDVRHCNVVIKFDPPEDFRSYIQSKGRARAQDSKYVVFTDTVEQTRLKIDEFKLINNKINEFLKSRVVDDSEENDMDIDFNGNEDNKYDFVPFGNDGPRITINSASSVLNRYIGKLRCNSISEAKILYKIENTSDNLFQASLRLPMPSPCVDDITGKPCSNTRRAKQFANLEACKLLFEYDELDSSLLPYNRYADEECLDSVKNKVPGEINQFEKYTACKLISNFPNFSESPMVLYLYSISYNPNVFLKLGINNVSMFNKSESLGFVMPHPIHQSQTVMKFPIYLVGGESTVVIKFECTLELNSDNFDVLLKCHKKLFKLYSKRIRKFNQNIKFEPTNSKSSLLVTILKDNKIDFEVIKEFINKKYVVNLCNNDQSSWIGSVIRPTYLKREYGAFVVSEVCSNMNADTFFHGKKMTYEQFYKNKYQINLTPEDKLYPLIKVIRLTTIQSCVNKEVRFIRNNKKLQRINESECFYIPCLTECISLSASLWTQLCIFPTIHHRVNQIFILEEFSSDIDFMDFSNNSCSYELHFDNCFNISHIESTEFSTDIVDFINSVFPCFMAKTCNDRTDLEQLEILGDSFLKYIASKYVFHFSKDTDNEGKLSSRRSRLISNSNLYDLAINKGLNKYFFYTNFNPKYNYLPPYFTVEKSTGSSLTDRNRQFISMKNKNLSDCVEALVGSFLTNYGVDYSVKFLLWLGLTLIPNDHNDGFEIQPESENVTFNQILIERGVPQSISDLEEILQYRFKSKSYLIQAITHPTSVKNRCFGCYQRLEFLGDSVLDFLVTVYIMLENDKLNPGKITNLRSALVNNNTFAYLSAHWGFHKFLDYFDSQMFSVLPNVVEEILKNKLENNNSFLKKSEKHKVIVKVLGDIFESIAGAIFVDSDYNLKTVWEVYRRLMKEPLKKYSNHIPKNKISMLHERYPNLKCTFEIMEQTNLIKLVAVVSESKTIEKIERNKALCKLALAEELEI